MLPFYDYDSLVENLHGFHEDGYKIALLMNSSQVESPLYVLYKDYEWVTLDRVPLDEIELDRYDTCCPTLSYLEGADIVEQENIFITQENAQ